MGKIVPTAEGDGIVPEPKNSKLTSSTEATTTGAEQNWEETYLKLLLLHADKVGFVQSFLVPTFEALGDMPTKCGVIKFQCAFLCAIIAYFTTQWEQFAYQGDEAKKQQAIMDGTYNSDFDEVYGLMWFFGLMLLPVGICVSILAWNSDIGQLGRFGALMEMAQRKPPKRDHSKPYGYTWYKEYIQFSVYGAAIVVPFVFAAQGASFNKGVEMGLLLLILLEPLNNINERYWKSTKISDAEVCITSGLQGQCFFAEGGGNAIAVNINVVAGLKWKNNKKREEVLKAAKKKKSSYKFQIFDTSSGFHTTITMEKMIKINESEGSVAKEVMKEISDNRDQIQEMLGA